MFTGLVTHVGTVASVARTPDGARLEVESPVGAELRRGDSVAVSGVCLTAVDVSARGFAADLGTETLRRSTLGRLGEGDRVNLELPLRAADRLGGHIVQGHVDGVGTVHEVVDEGRSRRVSVRTDAGLSRYVVEKGSVALDGVSLTAVDAGEDGFSVALVPETLESTTLGEVAAGDPLNVEVDVLAKYVERLMPAVGEPLAAGAER